MPIDPISDGEGGASVRAKLNDLLAGTTEATPIADTDEVASITSRLNAALAMTTAATITGGDTASSVRAKLNSAIAFIQEDLEVMSFLAEGEIIRAVSTIQPFGWAIPDGTFYVTTTYAADPYENGFTTWAGAFNSDMATALEAAGINTIRLPIDPGPMMAATTTEQLEGYFALFDTAISDITGRGFKCIVDWHPQHTHPANVVGYSFVDILAGLSSAKFLRYKEVTEAHLAWLDGLYSNDEVAVEIFNEAPFPAGDGGSPAITGPNTYYEHLAYLHATYRAISPGRSQIVSGASFALLSEMLTLDPDTFSPNTIFNAHTYSPPILAFQGVGIGWEAEDVERLEFPPEPRKKAAAIAAAPDATSYLTPYYDTPQGPQWLLGHLEQGALWADGHGIDRNRVFYGEYGLPADNGGITSAAPDTITRYERAFRQISEWLGVGYGKWEVQGGPGQTSAYQLFDVDQEPIAYRFDAYDDENLATGFAAAASAPSTLPAGWELGGANTASVEVIGKGTEDGVDYIDLRFYFASASTEKAASVGFQSWGSIAAVAGDTIRVDTRIRKIAETGNGLVSFGFVAFEIDAAYGYLGEQNIGFPGNDVIRETGPLPVLLRRAELTLANGSTAGTSVQMYVNIDPSAGATSVTLRVGAPTVTKLV